MVDEEVEKTLREIRERVRKTAEVEADSAVAVVPGTSNDFSASGSESNRTSQTMERIDAHLTTTARAWDRLPPLVSNRSGGLGRLELWVKRRFKQATRWYSWEQVNFNAAVHSALRDTLDALLDLEQQLVKRGVEMQAEMRAEMSAEIETRAQALAQIKKEAIDQLAEIVSQRSALESQRAETEAYRAETEAYRAQAEADLRALGLEMNDRLAELMRELRERDQQRVEEQTVCFKQLSLEMSEAEVLLDRTRRDIESRLNKLEGSKSESQGASKT